MMLHKIESAAQKNRTQMTSFLLGTVNLAVAYVAPASHIGANSKKCKIFPYGNIYWKNEGNIYCCLEAAKALIAI